MTRTELTPVEALRALFDAGVTKVSPGTLGMNMRGYICTDAEARWVAQALGLHWDGEWIHMEKRP